SRIVACEPDPDNLALLRRHVADLPNVTVIPAAVVGEEGITQASFQMIADKTGGNRGGGRCDRPYPGSTRIHVPAVSAVALWRKYCPDGCDLVKLDSEGAELQI